VAAVVDHEKEPCGCPPVAENLVAGTGVAGPATAGVAASATAPDTNAKAKTPEFPLAQSEGLAPTPPPPTEPAVPAGVPHAQVTIPFAYDGSHPPAAAEAAAPPVAALTAPAPAPAAPTTASPTNSGGDLWSGVKGFFKRLFGKKN
jgi:hypothetical protein